MPSQSRQLRLIASTCPSADTAAVFCSRSNAGSWLTKAFRLDIRPADLAEIDRFCDALWLEDGLARTTLASYRSDLARLAIWLAEHSHEGLLDVRESTLTAFVAHLAQRTRASSQARYLATLRRYYRWQFASLAVESGRSCIAAFI